MTERDRATLTKILASITLTPRVYSGPRARPATDHYQMLCRKLPVPLITALQSLEGPLTHHLEKAIKLYLLANGKDVE